MEQDPLSRELLSKAISIPVRTNPRGRPCLTKVVRFRPQPKSLVSRLLSEVKEKAVAKAVPYKSLGVVDHLAAQCNFEKIHTTDVDTCGRESEDPFITDFKNSTKINLHKNQDCKNKLNKQNYNYMLYSQGDIDSKQELSIKKEDNSRFSCDYSTCKYSCKLMSNLLKHKRIHTNERPYLCDQCTFRSNFVNSLKVHKRIHTSEQPYCCEQCGHRCNSISNLKKHSLQKHFTGKCK